MIYENQTKSFSNKRLNSLHSSGDRTVTSVKENNDI